MNKLRLIRTLLYYDVPQLFIAEDDNGVRYLCLLYSIEENGELKIIGVTVSADKLNDFIKGHVDLLTMFTSPELEDSIFHIHMKEEGIYAEHYNGILDSSMLPDEGYFYNIDCKKCKNYEQYMKSHDKKRILQYPRKNWNTTESPNFS